MGFTVSVVELTTLCKAGRTRNQNKHDKALTILFRLMVFDNASEGINPPKNGTEPDSEDFTLFCTLYANLPVQLVLWFALNYCKYRNVN